MQRHASLQAFLVFWAVNTLSLWVVGNLITGISFRDGTALILAGLVLGILNTFVRPVLVFLTFPITFVTLGLFLLVLNGAVLMFVSWLVPGFEIRGFGIGLIAALLVSVTSWLINVLIGAR
jgi:putative membrane protein